MRWSSLVCFVPKRRGEVDLPVFEGEPRLLLHGAARPLVMSFSGIEEGLGVRQPDEGDGAAESVRGLRDGSGGWIIGEKKRVVWEWPRMRLIRGGFPSSSPGSEGPDEAAVFLLLPNEYATGKVPSSGIESVDMSDVLGVENVNGRRASFKL